MKLSKNKNKIAFVFSQYLIKIIKFVEIQFLLNF